MKIAIVTITYFGDLKRARLLNETINTFFKVPFIHYIVIDRADEPHFKEDFTNAQIIIREDVFNNRFIRIGKILGRVLYLDKKKLRINRGWIYQQILKLAAHRYVHENIILFMDSDELVVDNVEESFFHDFGMLVKQERDSLGWLKSMSDFLQIEIGLAEGYSFVTHPVIIRKNELSQLWNHLVSIYENDLEGILFRQSFLSEYQLMGLYVSNIIQSKLSVIPETGIYWKDSKRPDHVDVNNIFGDDGWPFSMVSSVVDVDLNMLKKLILDKHE